MSETRVNKHFEESAERAAINLYSQQIIDFSRRILEGSTEYNMGWVEKFNSNIKQRVAEYKNQEDKFILTEFSRIDDSGKTTTLQIRLKTIFPTDDSLEEFDFFINYFYPADNRLEIVALSEVDSNTMLDLKKMGEIIDLEYALNSQDAVDSNEYFMMVQALLIGLGQK